MFLRSSIQTTKYRRSGAIPVLALLAASFSSVCTMAEEKNAADANDPRSVAFFETKIRPLLVAHCYECHSHETGESNGLLVVDSRTGLATGGTRGPAVVAGHPEKSWLIKAVEYRDSEIQMPPDKALPPEAVELFRQWIQAGATDPRIADPKTVTATAPRPEDHWAYRLPERTVAEKNPLGALDPIDSLLAARLTSNGLQPSPRADRRTLVRRLYFDLWGLPPEEHEIHRFEQDRRPQAYSLLVERLLAAPEFGERWTRYWMDVARYADTKGYVFQEDRNYPAAYRYRDWLINAWNSDLPYDEFIKYQLAADCLPESDASQLPATGFLTLGRRFLNNKQDIIDDRLDVTARGLMGMTLACARCHDHKYDPITAKDYYALYGVFLNTDEPGGDPWPHRLVDSKEDRKSFVLLRGSPGNRGEETERRFVSFLSKSEEKFSKGSGRLELAEQIASTHNPLTARVMVNRVWMRVMGASLVESPSDFGVRCAAPVHQDVLDHLAVDFMRSGWSVKNLVRRLVHSATYQQSSVAQNPQAFTADPQNSLYWRMNRRRSDFESLRDGVLSVSGQLKREIGGASEKIEAAPFSSRRTVYAFIDRQNVPSVFRNFDVASSDSHSPQRLPTTVPQQGLYMLNSDWILLQASHLAKQSTLVVDSSAPEAASQRLQWLFRTVLQRTPSSSEQQLAQSFLKSTENLPTVANAGNWECGWGEINSETTELKSFQHFPVFRKNQWCGHEGPPDKDIGWCIASKDGGHPGNDLAHATIRRWTAPRDGKVLVRGDLKHDSDQGDGVRCTALINQSQPIGQWTARKSSVATKLDAIPVKAGDQLDFVVDCMESPSFDSFNQTVIIKYEDGDRRVFNSTIDFASELPGPPIDPWTQLAQALLMTNEFAFVD